MAGSMKIIVNPKWKEVEKARTKCSYFLKKHGLSKDMNDMFSMVVSELIENGIKYGYFKLTDDNVIVNITIEDKIMTAIVINPIEEEAFEHLEKMDKMIQWIRGYQDPFEAYVERVKEVSKKHLNDKESGLGLVRIAYEGRAIIDFFLSENNLLNVSAVSYYN